METKLTKAAREELARAVRTRYQAATGKAKHEILSEFIAISGYHPKYAIEVLNREEFGPKPPQERKRPRLYDDAAKQALIVLWEASKPASEIPGLSVSPFPFHSVRPSSAAQGCTLRPLRPDDEESLRAWTAEPAARAALRAAFPAAGDEFLVFPPQAVVPAKPLWAGAACEPPLVPSAPAAPLPAVRSQRSRVAVEPTAITAIDDPSVAQHGDPVAQVEDFLNRYRRSNIEFLGSGLYHPVFPLIPQADWDAQTEWWLGLGRHLLGRDRPFPGAHHDPQFFLLFR